MIPASYKPQEPEYDGPKNRRKDDNMDQGQLWEKLGNISESINGLKTAMDDIKAEQKNIYSEIEAVRNEVRESRDLHQDDYTTIEKKFHGHVARVEEKVDNQRINYQMDQKELDRKLKDIERWQDNHDTRLKDNPWRRYGDKAIGALVSAGAIGAVFYIAQVIASKS